MEMNLKDIQIKVYEKEIEAMIKFLDMVGEDSETLSMIQKEKLSKDEILELFKNSMFFECIYEYSKKVYRNNEKELKRLDEEKRNSMIKNRQKAVNSKEKSVFNLDIDRR